MPIIECDTYYARNAQNPTKIHEMVSSEEPIIRQYLCYNPLISPDDLRTLAQDKIKYVAETAKLMIQRLKIQP